MSRTDEILRAAKMPPEAVKMSRMIDVIYFPILCILLVGIYHMYFMKAFQRGSNNGCKRELVGRTWPLR